MVAPLRHRQTKWRQQTCLAYCHRATSRLYPKWTLTQGNKRQIFTTSKRGCGVSLTRNPRSSTRLPTSLPKRGEAIWTNSHRLTATMISAAFRNELLDDIHPSEVGPTTICRRCRRRSSGAHPTSPPDGIGSHS